MIPKAPSPWPLSIDELTEKYVIAGLEDLFREEHTHLLAEAVREAKYSFIKSVLDEAERLSDKYQPEPAVMAAFFEVAGPIVDEVAAAKKASELRKGATPENGGKDA